MIHLEKRKSVSFIKKYILLTVITVLVIVAATILVPMGSVGAGAALFLIIVDVILLLSMFILSLINLIRHIFRKDNSKFEFLFIFNFIFATIVTTLFLVFYFIIFFGALIILLPFLG